MIERSQKRAQRELLCPSAATDDPRAKLIGIVLGSEEAPRVEYLEQPLPMTDELRALSGPVESSEIYRVASPCSKQACHYYSGHHCRLGEHIAARPVSGEATMPACGIRNACRWFAEQGRAACARCQLVVRQLPTAPVARTEASPPRRYLPVV